MVKLRCLIIILLSSYHISGFCFVVLVDYRLDATCIGQKVLRNGLVVVVNSCLNAKCVMSYYLDGFIAEVEDFDILNDTFVKSDVLMVTLQCWKNFYRSHMCYVHFFYGFVVEFDYCIDFSCVISYFW